MPAPLILANAGGFWGDRNDALLDQVRGGPVHVVMLDYLAEITMSILRRQRERHPEAGYARDLLVALEPALDDIVAGGIAVVTNAGGMNPEGCARAVGELLRGRGHAGVNVGVVTGDDVLDRLDALLADDELRHLDTGAPLASVRSRVLSANAYLGAAPIAEAIRRGAQIVITGRCTDSALALGPLVARFGWQSDDHDRLAAGVVAGHVIECGAQASGGNFCGGWADVPELERVGYPIAEVDEDGTMVITKHPGLGGRVSAAVVKEQLLYEIGDPAAYLTPDVTADFTTIRLQDLGGDRVRLSGIEGRPPPDRLKISISHHAGFSLVVGLTFVWPHAAERARATERLLLARAEHLGIALSAYHTNLIGVSGAHGPMAPVPGAEPNEVLFRMAIRTADADAARRFAREVAPLITSGVPGACGGMIRGRPEPSPIVDFWPALIARDAVTPKVEVFAA